MSDEPAFARCTVELPGLSGLCCRKPSGHDGDHVLDLGIPPISFVPDIGPATRMVHPSTLVEPYRRIVATPLEDQVGKLCRCVHCEEDGVQHEPQCSVHGPVTDDPPCDCGRRE